MGLGGLRVILLGLLLVEEKEEGFLFFGVSFVFFKLDGLRGSEVGFFFDDCLGNWELIVFNGGLLGMLVGLIVFVVCSFLLFVEFCDMFFF